jgi:hypothetical protein
MDRKWRWSVGSESEEGPSAYSSRRMALLERLGDSGIMAISRFKLVLSNVLRGYLQDEKVQSRFQRNFDC